ncbi:hypothetical protein PHMEG_0002896 [Phytophthora megakarya]|uniref:Gem-associated protein 5 TPR domain-containing protein n=1 Tax=Phytophthora megakarya TaxID=4795 RepID=A0A225WZB9_9STRA|nr:hypothetical protein PHMEG_0002896 [Phytophthora megakarya]
MEMGAAVAKEGHGDMLSTVHGKDHLRLLPPSANWYCSKICDWGRSDVFGLLFAFGAKNSVFIYQVGKGLELQEDKTVVNMVTSGDARDGVKVSFFAQLVRGKRDRRVTAVQFLTDSTGELRLVCGGEEGSVQIWDVASLTMIEQHRKHKAEVMAVTVSTALDATFVVAGDRQGRISAWERDTGKVSVFMPISGDGVHSMAISPHDKTLVAVGYRSGILCLVDASQGIIRHRLAGHDQELQCVAWKSTIRINRSGSEGEDSMEAESDRVIWLASSSRDKTIKVWNITASEEPALEQVLRLPTGKQGMSFTQTKQLWLPVAWSVDDTRHSPEKHCLWSGSFDGSLFRWEWGMTTVNGSEQNRKNRCAQCKPVVVKGGHNRMLFSIVIVPTRKSAPTEEDAVTMLTVSLDRELRLWKEHMSSKSSSAICIEKLVGLGGHAYSVSHNAATGIVAAGIGDQSIRLWNVGPESTSITSDYQCDLLWKGLQSKVTCVRWHPFQHSILAYGMEDGRIGVYDIKAKKYNHFRTSHDREVQQLQWIVLQPKDTGGAIDDFLESIQQLEAAQVEGQSLDEALYAQEGQARKNRGENDVKILLWSCDTGGCVLESNADAVDQKSLEVLPNCVAFEWEEQHGLVAVGRSNGVVEIVKWSECAENCTTMQHFHEHLETVTCLAWSKTTYYRLLASGGQDGKIFVYSVAETNPNDEILPSSQESRLLGSHSNKITNLKWCSVGDQHVLASASADGSVQVWNYTSLQMEACFNHHIGRVLSLEWVSSYVLVTGGEDQTLRLWDYREQRKETSSKRKKRGKVKQPQEIGTIASSPSAYQTAMQIQNGEVANADTVAVKSSANNCDDQSSVNSKPKKKNIVVFHPETKLTAAEIASACCRVARVNQQDSASDNMDGKNPNIPIDNLLAHTDRISLRDFFASESKRFRDKGEWESLANTLLLQGNVIEALQIVAKAGALTPTWISYAPMAGMDVWREMTNLYSHQLDSQGDNKAAAFHFLSIGKVRSAVASLVSGDSYIEAIALIRSRLGTNDPLLHDTLWKYTEFLSKRDRQGEIALTLLNIGSVKAKTRAIHKLVNTGDMIYVRAALDMLISSEKCVVKASNQPEMDQESDDDRLKFPASFFVSIAGLAISKNQCDVAETSGQLLQSPLVGSSSPSHRLMSCVLSILNAIDEHRLVRCTFTDVNGEMMANRVDDLLQAAAPKSVREFFEFLIRSRKEHDDEDAYHLYKHVMDKYASSKEWMVKRADQFWFQVLNACRRSGYWFDTDGEARVQEAQNLLVEANCFADIKNAVATSAHRTADTATTSLLQVAEGLLRFVLDSMSLSFIGALEQLRTTFLLLIQVNHVDVNNGTTSTRERNLTRSAGDLRLDVMSLLFPYSFAFPNELPQCGELEEEQLDTLVLWSSVLLSQCRIILASLATRDCADNLESMIRLLLHSLGIWFHDNASALNQGLMNADNQLQLHALMKEVLVSVHQLSHEHEENEQNRVDGQTGNMSKVSSKEALINDVNDMRSRLTWCDDNKNE